MFKRVAGEIRDFQFEQMRMPPEGGNLVRRFPTPLLSALISQPLTALAVNLDSFSLS
jgi:hypothetical protein